MLSRHMPSQVLDVLELQQQLDEDGITALVHRFYERVRDEPLLGPIFATRIDDDQWPRHLDKMVRFWSTVLLGSNSYLGNPMLLHGTLPGLTHAHFDRWLELFREVAEEVMTPAVAAAVAQRAERMGAQLRLMVLA